MLCPSCSSDLSKIQVTTSSGGHFDIDHCGRCGGTWFDPYEINRIPYHEVMRLAHLTVWKHQVPSFANQTFHCPRDSHLLEKYQSNSLPAGVVFLRCKYCFGLWATQRALEDFKKKQEEKIDYYKKAALPFPALSVVFVPALLITLLFFTTLLTILNLQKAKDSRTQAQTLVSHLNVVPFSKTAVSLTFDTSESLASKITFGTSALTRETKWVSAKPATSHKIFLRDLEPDAVYTYTITLTDPSGRSLTTEAQTFTTR